MFFIFALLATFFYALNNVLLTPYARNIDPLVVTSYRGIAIGLMALPIFLFYYFDGLYSLDSETLILIVVACTSTLIGNVAFYMASRALPVGIAAGICLSFSTIFIIALGKFLLHEHISFAQYVLIATTLFIVIMISVKSDSATFQQLDVKKGVFYSFLFGIFLGTGYFLVGSLSKRMDPLVAGYFWETGIGIVGFIVVYFRSLLRKNIFSFETKKMMRIGFAASPTILGTSCFAYATTIGPMSIVGAILPLVSVITSVLAVFYLKEKLATVQWLLIAVLVAVLCGLKLASS